MIMKFLLPNFQVYAFPACDTTGGLILPRFLHTGLDAPATTISYLYLAIPTSTRVRIISISPPDLTKSPSSALNPSPDA